MVWLNLRENLIEWIMLIILILVNQAIDIEETTFHMV